MKKKYIYNILDLLIDIFFKSVLTVFIFLSGFLLCNHLNQKEKGTKYEKRINSNRH